MAIYKPQSPIEKGEHYIYPLTTHDQVILPNGSRWDGEYIDVDLDKAADGTVVLSNADKLGGKAPEYYIQPRNLLDNSDFRNPVMQAGFNGKHGTDTYIIDRWKHLYNLGTATHEFNGIKISGADFYMHQKIDATYLIGKTLTMAVHLSDGNTICGTFVLENISDTSVIASSLGLYLMITADGFAIRLDDVNWEHTLVWAALYEGEYTAETLPPYVPKGYGAELAECRRYYQHHVFVDAIKLSSGLYTVSYYHGMRTSPTITFVTFQPYGSQTVTDFTDCSIVEEENHLRYATLPTCSSSGTGALCIILDADL